MNNSANSRTSGLTLIEVLVALAILSVIATFTSAMITGLRMNMSSSGTLNVNQVA